MTGEIESYRNEVAQELNNILSFWMTYTIDEEQGGFYGKVDNENNADASAPKGSVLNSRILYTFSAAYNQTKKNEYLLTAERAYHYIVNYFIDKEFGGLYWSVDCKGNALDTKKQIYAIAFAIYGLSEYSLTTGNQEAKEHAKALYHSIEKYSHDTIKLGYLEALSREWKEMEDLRLSAKDWNERKTMNTHLHVLEAYANLYGIWPAEQLKDNIIELINLFFDKMLNHKTWHLNLFFDDDWNAKPGIVSYGHDIEAAWLIQQTAEIIKETGLVEKVKSYSIKIARAAIEGIAGDGGLWYELETKSNHLIKEKHWWPQAEAMVGFFNAWQLTGEQVFLENSLGTWHFTKQHLLDKKYGEWFWGVKEDDTLMEGEDKVGFWKCPYHNGRACMEIMRRTSEQI